MRRFLSVVFWIIFVFSLGPAAKQKTWDLDTIVVTLAFTGLPLALAITFWKKPPPKDQT